ncbi:MAG: aminotransferase class V-fold PLP-dependent enzyme [Verrucomicrobia bacterium]|nr:aminotransferase class V-fold PLP-dependent enzyme [Prolixibacteraceae bacterium]
MEKELIKSEVHELNKVEKVIAVRSVANEAYTELEKGIYRTLKTYTNVHRGSGHYSMITTRLYEMARDLVIDYLGLDKNQYEVIFGTPQSVAPLIKRLEAGSYQLLSSNDLGLSLGVRALAVKKERLPKGRPFITGGGSARLISQDWVVWAASPDKFEAGTPAIINIITFAKALWMKRQGSTDLFWESSAVNYTPEEVLYQDDLEQYEGSELLDQLLPTLIGKNIKVPTMAGDRPYINLDNSASTPAFMPVLDAFYKTWRQSEQSKQAIIEEVKSICAQVLNAPLDDYDMIFTSNTTEAINLAAESMNNEPEVGFAPVVLSTLIEHSSNDLPWRMLPHCSVLRLTTDADGFVDLKELETLLKEYNDKCHHGNKRIRLLAISGASNVLGVCNKLANISKVVHKYGVALLVDAAQLIAHRSIDIEGSGIDYLAFSAHKVYAPFGSGMLIARKGLLNFSTAEKKAISSSGEENAGGIAALGKALMLMKRIGMDVIQQKEQELTKRALTGMAGIPGLKVYGNKGLDSASFAHKIGVIVFSMKSMLPSRLANELAVRRGIGVRSGCHCAHMTVKQLLHIPHALENFQRLLLNVFPKLSLPGLVRVSFGIENSKEDIDTLINELRKIAGQSPSSPASSTAAESKGIFVFSKEEVQLQIDDLIKDISTKVYDMQ